jgi:hypothetical protein
MINPSSFDWKRGIFLWKYNVLLIKFKVLVNNYS